MKKYTSKTSHALAHIGKIIERNLQECTTETVNLTKDVLTASLEIEKAANDPEIKEAFEVIEKSRLEHLAGLKQSRADLIKLHDEFIIFKAHFDNLILEMPF